MCSSDLERELEMLIRMQLLFVYFKVLEESHFTLGKKNKTKQNKKHETDNRLQRVETGKREITL